MLLSAMVAVSENNVIGAEGGLPWRLSNDLKWFKKTTMGKPVIMGRKTFESLPKLLSGRANIVITRETNFQAAGAIITHSLDEALEAGKKAARTLGVSEIVVIGGAEIYRQSLEKLNRIYLTRVHATVDGDTFFPDLGSAIWKESAREFHQKSEKDMFDHSFIVLNRVARATN
ncbi:MAG: dihydrofolate reductase [Alphaproteobacteria bacterium]|nr:MAG: dihydrofolate reductase [Alphaproteobacteria bacterium]